MRNQIFSIIIFFLVAAQVKAQFHTLKIPQASNYVKETQRLGVTDITIEYHSPKVNGREVWDNDGIIPQNGTPIAWRAGANMNTTIEFSTDVAIEGQQLKAGRYGFHIIPHQDTYTLLFAHNNNQWGSYYLDMENDISLKVEVSDTICSFSESLDYEFIPSDNNTLFIGLEWADKRIPFEVTVDLNETVIASFRSELRGINTYHWQAWNDAAKWCLRHDTNLEEALTWASRSIEGGYNGFAANKNMENLTTKAQILDKLGKGAELASTVNEAAGINFTPMQANNFSITLLRMKEYEKALEFASNASKKYPGTWFLELNHGISNYFNGKTKTALKLLRSAETKTPASFQNRLSQIMKEVEEGTYTL